MGKKDRDRKQKQKQKDNKRQNPFNDGNKKRKGRGKGKTKQDKNWDKYFNEFQEYLKPKGIFMRDVEGDGNCLFRSIADFVDGNENEHEQYRRMAVEYIEKNKEYFALFLPTDDEKIDDYIKDMSEDGTWGGHFELVALSTLLNVKFCLHIKDQEPVIVKSSEKDLRGTKMVHLAYHVDEHYSSVRRIGDDDKAPAEPIRLEVKDDDDSSGSDSDSEGDSTEGSDKGVKALTKEVEKLHLKDKKNKNKGKGYDEEEYKRDEGKGKNQKNKDKDKDKDKDKKEEKGKHGKKKGR